MVTMISRQPGPSVPRRNRNDSVMFSPTRSREPNRRRIPARVSWSTCLSRAPQERSQLFNGRSTWPSAHAAARHLDAAAVDHWWLCGRSAWCRRRSACSPSWAVTARTVHREMFTSRTSRPPATPPRRPRPGRGDRAARGRSSNCYRPARHPGSGRRPQRVRPGPPFACRAGCAAPAAPVVDGEVTMRRNTPWSRTNSSGLRSTAVSAPYPHQITVDTTPSRRRPATCRTSRGRAATSSPIEAGLGRTAGHGLQLERLRWTLRHATPSCATPRGVRRAV